MESTPKRGILFAATGPEYLRLATRAARSARAANPGISIDLATDQPEPPDVFDAVRPLAPGCRHPKLHAMPETRFEQTLYLDADLFVLANIEDVFFLLDRFDIAMAHAQFRNSKRARNPYRQKLFNAFPQYNSGVVAFRRTEPVLDFLTDWRNTALTSKARFDQPCLRELLWESELRIATLPAEYNLLHYQQLRAWSKNRPAPRILHHGRFHTKGNRPMVRSVPELLGWTLTRKLRRALGSDAEIRNQALIRISASDVAREWRRRVVGKLTKWLRPREAR
ncbi:MAG: putative nucleotide-diphospho-sugar transferase [Paracoccaceae bacterium]